MHSPKFERVKGYFDKGLWNTTMVRNAVVKYWITVEEFEEITGEPIEEENEDGLVNDNTND